MILLFYDSGLIPSSPIYRAILGGFPLSEMIGEFAVKISSNGNWFGYCYGALPSR